MEQTKTATVPIPKKEFPTRVVLSDGREITVESEPGLRQFFDETVKVAAQNEKNKLYSNIQGKDAKISELTTENNNLATQLQETMGLAQSNVNEYNKMKQQLRQYDEQGVAQFMQEHNGKSFKQVMLDTFREVLPELMQAEIAPIRQQLEINKQQEVEAYKAQKLIDLKDEIIPELVSGNTKEEIDASIEFAKSMRQKYSVAAPTTQQNNSVAGNNGSTTTAGNTGNVQQPQQNSSMTQQQQQTPAGATENNQQQQPEKIVVPNVSMYAATNDVDLPDIAGMDNDDFGKNREELLKKLKSAYGK